MNNVYFYNKEIAELIVKLDNRLSRIEKKLSPKEYRRMFIGLDMILPEEIKHIRTTFRKMYGLLEMDSIIEVNDVENNTSEEDNIVDTDNENESESTVCEKSQDSNIDDEDVAIPPVVTRANQYRMTDPALFNRPNEVNITDTMVERSNPILRSHPILPETILVRIMTRLRNGDTPEQIQKDLVSDNFDTMEWFSTGSSITVDVIRSIDERMKFAGPNAVLWIIEPVRINNGPVFHSFTVHPFIKDAWQNTPKKDWKFEPFMYDDGADKKPITKQLRHNKKSAGETLVDILKKESTDTELDDEEMIDIIKETNDSIDIDISPSSK